jgi:hypothetical protein
MSAHDEVSRIQAGPARAMSTQVASKTPTTERFRWPTALPDGSGYVVLFDGTDGLASQVVCCEVDGSVRWQALPPEGENDSWTQIEVQSDAVVGTSASGWRIAIDSASGSEVTRQPDLNAHT